VDVALLALLHLLVLVDWLGGNLGAFVASFKVTDTAASPHARVASAGLIASVDLASRIALILAAPTGVTLATAKGSLKLAAWALPTLWIAALVWLALTWRQRLTHGTGASLIGRADALIPCAAFASLVVAAFEPTPLFPRIKCALLSSAIAAGLAIRLLLKPFGSALAGLASGEPTDARKATLAVTLERARRAVLSIWVLILAAASFGVATPT
jgi:hypothetical protein